MKTLLPLLIVCILQISITRQNEIRDSKILIRSYPKKVRTPMQKSIKIINARKFGRLGTLESRKANFKKNSVKKTVYTVFPPIAEKKVFDVPESFHFQGDVNRKPRVKKVLPEYGFSLFRRKRSADISLNNTGVENMFNKTRNDNRRKSIRKKLKRKGLNKGTNNATLRKLKKKVAKNKSHLIIPYLRDKKKKRNIRTDIIRHGKKRSPASFKYTKKHKNQPKLLYPDDKPIGLKRHEVNNSKLNLNKDLKGYQERKVRNRRLIAGRDAMIKDYPYVVSIQRYNKHWCAGALLNPRLVITTANCVWKSRSVSRMRIRAGSRYMERGGQVVKIAEVVKHPKWSIRSLPDNDVALLLLNKNVKFSDSVHSVDLPNRAMSPAFDDVWVTSWGAERRDGIFQTVGVSLQVYHAMLMDHDKCNNITQRFGVAVSRNFICVAQTGRRAPCTRDTGAPAVSDGILWGLASWGIRKLCGTERFPAMFSYLASRSNLDFITNATHYLMSDKRFYPYPDRFAVDNDGVASTAPTTRL